MQVRGDYGNWAGSKDMKKRAIHTLGPIISLALFAVALFIIHYKLRHYHYRDVVAEMSQIPTSVLNWAAVRNSSAFVVGGWMKGDGKKGWNADLSKDGPTLSKGEVYSVNTPVRHLVGF